MGGRRAGDLIEPQRERRETRIGSRGESGGKERERRETVTGDERERRRPGGRRDGK